MNYVVNSKKIFDILDSDKPESLESEFELEDVLSYIKILKDKTTFLSELKKQRAKVIQNEIDKHDEKIKFLEDVVLLTLESVNKKTLDFPGVGKATKVERKGKWIVKDDTLLLDYLKTNDLAAYNEVVSQKDIISKKDLDKILEIWENTNQLPDCVEHEASSTSLKIKFQDITVEEADEVEESGEEDDGKFDGLEF